MKFSLRKNLRKPLSKNDHKYSRGVVAVAAGTSRYPGAALLTVGGARHGGAGYVKLLSSEPEIRNLVVSQFPDVVPVSTLNRERFDSLVIGPGGAVVKKLPDLLPVVLDSGALTLALKKRPTKVNFIYSRRNWATEKRPRRSYQKNLV